MNYRNNIPTIQPNTCDLTKVTEQKLKSNYLHTTHVHFHMIVYIHCFIFS